MLRNAGIDSFLRRTPKTMTVRGCGYSLQLREKVFIPALKQLENAQLPFGQVYAIDDKGVLEEVTV